MRGRAKKTFSKLSNSWFSTSVGFFEVVPRFSQQNIKMATNEFASVLRETGEKRGVKIEKFSDGDTKVIEYKLPIEDLALVSKKFGKSTSALRAVRSMSRAALGALVSEYEAFISDLLKVAGAELPAAFIEDGDTISLSRLREFETLEGIEQAILDEKIEDILHHKSHVEVIKTIEKKFGVDLSSNKQLVAEFVEVCQRRHLLTHCGGIVNRRYLEVCTTAGCKLGDLPKLGETVTVSSKYLRRATARVFQMGYFSLHILWQKLLPQEAGTSHNHILTASHDFLEFDLTKMCRRTTEFLSGSKVKPSEQIEVYALINRALSYLYDDSLSGEIQRSEVEKVLSKKDWSLVSPLIRLALVCLRRDYSNLSALVKSAKADGLEYRDAMTWQIFKEIREKPEFSEQFI